MRVIADIQKMQAQSARWRRRAERVAFVPTMGGLHAGHLSLVRRARQAVGRRGRVVVSIYVNPTQFGPGEDFSSYPRRLKRDLSDCRQADVDVVFTPSDREMYPGKAAGRFSTYVVDEQLSRLMEGVSRPTHFKGVTTVVAKLFNIVQPDVAVFGAKDWQQAAMLKRMVSGLNFPIHMIVAPTVRERDGLALSSRNQYLTPVQRQQATLLWESIRLARKEVRQAETSAARLRTRIRKLVREHPAARLDYVEFFQPDTLEPVRTVRRGSHMALAVFFGRTRLIDNGRL
jgi:pantoate--beta-alanine ligase